MILIKNSEHPLCDGKQGKTCCICEGPLATPADGTWEGGHNALPYAKGRCCRSCRDMHVLPARLLPSRL